MMRCRLSFVTVLIAFAMAAGIAGCGDSKQTAAGKEVALKWLGMVDGERYGESWTNSAAAFRNAMPQDQWEQAAASVRKPMGKLLSRKVKSATYKTSLPGAPDGEYVMIVFETSFENKKEAIETVTPMKDPDGQWRVSGYYIK